MLSVKGLALTVGILCAACVFLIGLGNLIWPSYGVACLEIARSIYPGYASTTGFWGVIVGTLYALLDGAILGALAAWLYNRFSGAASRVSEAQQRGQASQPLR